MTILVFYKKDKDPDQLHDGFLAYLFFDDIVRNCQIFPSAFELFVLTSYKNLQLKKHHCK